MTDNLTGTDISTARRYGRLPHEPGDARAAAEVVRGIWAHVLEVSPDSVDVHHSDFFEMGGYSLLALQAIGRILAAYGVDEVEAVEWEGELLNRLFENATVEGQAEFLAEKGCGSPLG
ncbi:acyl carrier protein [Streptomyces niveiscabiei]|uniref:acyl carrier protein n=1 Tax=Streptomyces niveiscabiei TaxID=164115 RepID=UPI0029A7CABA|nr:acyl carrier protein [Streptomyces niveiscabiei]MDX3382464.1 acyl carrier protein [Streptomyces niveiscabiei]